MRTQISKIAFAVALGIALCFAQNTPEKLAVYVSGAGEVSINKSLGSKLFVVMTQGGEYSGIADPNSFQDELAKGNKGDIAQIYQTAKRYGADYVCVVNMVEVFGAHSISARLIKIASSQVVKTGSSDRSLKTIDDLTAVSNELARQLLLQSSHIPPSSPTPAPVSEPEQPLKFSSDWLKEPIPQGFAAQLKAHSPTPVDESAPKHISAAQALSNVNLPSGCSEDFVNLLGKDGFDMAKFMKDLPVDVAKVKLQLKSPFGKPKDSDKTGSGLSVGCVKALPESPAEITFLLKDIGLKMGLNLATGAAASTSAATEYALFEDKSYLYSVPTSAATESNSNNGLGIFIGIIVTIVLVTIIGSNI